MTKALLGLTGGIGAGKNVVGGMLAGLGATVVDADQIAREIVAPGTPALEEIRTRWGTHVLDNDGHLNRKALAAIVFTDARERRALEAILHPRIIAQSQRIVEASEALIGVHMAALLIESGGSGRCNAIWVTSAPEEVRITRVMARDNASRSVVEQRLRTQLPESQRVQYADRIINTDQPLESLALEVAAQYTELCDAVRADRLEKYRRAKLRGDSPPPPTP